MEQSSQIAEQGGKEGDGPDGVMVLPLMWREGFDPVRVTYNHLERSKAQRSTPLPCCSRSHTSTQSMAEEIGRYAVTFKKVPGTLSLTKTHVAWVATAAGSMDRQQQALNRVTSE